MPVRGRSRLSLRTPPPASRDRRLSQIPRGRQPPQAPIPMRDFQSLVAADGTNYANLARMNANVQENRKLLKLVLRKMTELKPQEYWHLDEAKKQCREIIIEYLRTSMETLDGVIRLLDGKRENQRDVLWVNLDAKYRVEGKHHNPLRAYMLNRLHNRRSRLLPSLVLYWSNIGGALYHIVCSFIECCIVPSMMSKTYIVVLWNWMCTGERDLQGDWVEYEVMDILMICVYVIAFSCM